MAAYDGAVAADGAPMRPGDAGRAIGVKPSTLRIYAQRFGELLSSEATGGSGGYRLFTQADVALLCRARVLLERGFTYERAAAELRPPPLSDAPAAAPRRRVRAAVGSALADRLAILEQAVEAWRALAEERALEVAALRQELRDLRAR